MNSEFLPVVSEEIWSRHPDYRALSITVQGFRITGSPHPTANLVPPPWLDGHLEAWRDAFRGFGSNPKKTSCSVEALWKRMQKNGGLPAIDPVVDLYNALSIRYGAPFGGENAALYAGPPRLVLATGSEQFDTARDGAPVIEHPDPGEVIWCDNQGVTCRRWNWRQCRRTALTSSSQNLWFVIDRLEPMPVAELIHAGEELIAGLRSLSPTLQATTTLLESAK